MSNFIASFISSVNSKIMVLLIAVGGGIIEVLDYMLT